MSDPKQEAADRAAAEAKLQQMIAVKDQAREQQEMLIAEKRAKDQAAAEEAEARRQQAARQARYAPYRRDLAARQRHWASITVPDINVNAYFNSYWKDDQLFYRVALMGQPQAMNAFLQQWNTLGINFADQSGRKLFAFTIDSRSFERAPLTVNDGVPTMEMRGEVPMDLPDYERSVQWNLTWAQ